METFARQKVPKAFFHDARTCDTEYLKIIHGDKVQTVTIIVDIN